MTKDLSFHTAPLGSAIPIQSTLISVCHQPVTSLDDPRAIHIKTETRLWLRVADPNSSKRKLRSDSIMILRLFDFWLKCTPPSLPMRAKQYWPGTAAADACASRSWCQIGGFVKHTSGRQCWFSEKFSHDDFAAISMHLDSNMQWESKEILTNRQFS